MQRPKTARILVFVRPEYRNDGFYQFSLEAVFDKSNLVNKRIQRRTGQGINRDSDPFILLSTSDKFYIPAVYKTYTIKFEFDGALMARWNFKKGEADICLDPFKALNRREVVAVPRRNESSDNLASIVFTHKGAFVHRVTIANVENNMPLHGLHGNGSRNKLPAITVSYAEPTRRNAPIESAPSIALTNRETGTRHGNGNRNQRPAKTVTSVEPTRLDTPIKPEKYKQMFTDASLLTLAKQLGPNNCESVLTFLDIKTNTMQTKKLDNPNNVTQAYKECFIEWRNKGWVDDDDKNIKLLFEDLMEAIKYSGNTDVKPAIDKFLRSESDITKFTPYFFNG